MTEERLQKVLAKAGIGSRRACEDLIRQRRVRVDGKVAELGCKVDARRSRILVDGRPIPPAEELVYIALHKPAGILSVMHDDRGRPALDSILPVSERLYPVGRLDLPSEGLLLLTNDGRLAYRLSHPRFEHPKTYAVLVSGDPDEEALNRLRQGVVIDGHRTQPTEVQRLAEPPPNLRRPIREAQRPSAWLEIVLREGRKRQIRSMCDAVGYPVLRLVRTAIGPLRLGSLAPRQWRELTADELKDLKRMTGSRNELSDA